MKRIVVVITLLSLFSCSDKEVLLPQEEVSVMREIVDHSPIYMFFKTESNQYNKKKTDTIIEVNRKNSISSTNWVFNIDKRLPLKLVIPELIVLQNKKKKSSHAKEGTMNVFTYSDSVSKNLAFLPFTDVKFEYRNQLQDTLSSEIVEKTNHSQKLNIYFKKDNSIVVDGNEVSRNEFIDFVKKQTTTTVGPGKAIVVCLHFDDRLTYKQYLHNKILVWRINSDKVQLSSTELILKHRK
ncbi:hypothetical protein NAT47_07550 [Flavobacterium sp. HXWNR69]|uniref:Lipoprotein n=1 Tax=Flavobacterium fragile TaxID=2949085 RepID=A0ABT0THG1_9FLAO|nr:hypothetical protein [Flavobacterium sp. HXWNR69]MCL9770268.1 hypothetical protein [Flavobacterium sp. HXWNR69]